MASGPTALVTGGAGFIGSHVVDELVMMGMNVVVLDDLSGGFLSNVNPKATFIEGSITNKALVEKLFETYRFDYVYHLAAYAAEGLSYFIPDYNYMNNVMGSVNLITAATRTKVKCFVFTSSIAVYGSGQVPMLESTVPQPEDPYGNAKNAVETHLKIFKKMHGLNYIIFRPHNVYGERQNIGDKYRNVIGIFMNRILKGEPMPIFGDGRQERAFSYIKDVAPVIACSVTHTSAYSEIFNIGADRPYSVNVLACAVAKAMGVEPKIEYMPVRKEALVAYSDHSKVRMAFGLSDTYVSLEDGLARMAEWVKKEGAKESKEFANIEITENLPPSWRTK